MAAQHCRVARFFRRRQQSHPIAELNLTNLIDLGFTLLIIFMIATPLIDQDKKDEKKELQQLPLELPESGAAANAPAQPEPLVISVDSDGKTYLGTRRVGVEELHRVLRDAASKHPKIRIDGDRRAPFEPIARVIDLCEFEGLREIAVRTRDR